ncbi:MAG: glycoside hydrolase family 30 protein [Elusimicrobia bacterium]|nr:glycoside hydrolase family 30 protein [Elusimicrobiota bacterium]
MKKNLKVRQFCTSQGTQHRISELPPIVFYDKCKEAFPAVILDKQKIFQTIEGFGGAFTEAAATTFYKMNSLVQEEILKAYFDPKNGHGYSLCRTHINSCDFALGNYAYTEVDGDVNLKHFSIDHDRQALIPLIKSAMAVKGADFKLFASPWSPPAWMKTTGKMNDGGKLKPEYRTAWAKYYARYIKEYAREKIRIWGLTVQNEPNAAQRWDSCMYTAEEERDFVRDFLGPVLRKENLSNVKIIIWDHNRDLMYQRAKVVFDDPKAAKYVWGTGFHWYCDDKFENVQILHDAYPDKKLLFTEGCQEGGPHTGSWALGEKYARSMINDLNRWCVGWTDWNLILDERGGPNHVGNFCSAPIIADTKTGKLHYQSSYFYIGHFSRFIRPGAKRIVCSTTRDSLEATAFINKDGTIAVIVLNRTENDIAFTLNFKDKSAETDIPKHSIKTFQIL